MQLNVSGRRGELEDSASAEQYVISISVEPAPGSQIALQRLSGVEHAITLLYPNCLIAFTSVDGTITAGGVCDSEANAHRILSLARRTCLAPIRDLIEVRGANADAAHETRMRWDPASGFISQPLFDSSGISDCHASDCPPNQNPKAAHYPLHYPGLIETLPPSIR